MIFTQKFHTAIRNTLFSLSAAKLNNDQLRGRGMRHRYTGCVKT